MLADVTTHVGSTASPTLPTDGLPAALSDVTGSNASLRGFLHGLPGVDQVGAEARAASLGTRSVKTTAKAYALDLAIRMVDLTTLEGADTVGKVRALSAKAMRPDPADPTCPATAAVCVYPDMVATAKQTLGGSGVHGVLHVGQLDVPRRASAGEGRGHRGDVHPGGAERLLGEGDHVRVDADSRH